MFLPSTTTRKIMRELSKLQSSPPEGIRLCSNALDGDDTGGLGEVDAWVQGPPGTAFEGGFFKIRFTFTPDYPAVPPKCKFVTKVFHPNVNPADGDICVNTLKKDWIPTMGIEHVLIVIKCLLINPNPASALHAEAGHLLLEDYATYAQRARLMTSIHATPRVAPSEFAGEVQEERRPLGESDAGNATAASPVGGEEKVSADLAGVKVVKSEVKKAATGATKKRGLKRL